MLFLNMGMLLGLALVGVPVIIHLLNRRSAKHIPWGAMQFLLDSLVRRRRRILIEEMLLLAVRCLMFAALALAMARPFVPAGSRVPWQILLPLGMLAIAGFGVSFALWRYPRRRRWVAGGALALAGLAALLVVLEDRLNLHRFGRGGERDVAIVIDGSLSMRLGADGKPNFERAREEAERVIRESSRRTSFSLVVGGSVPFAHIAAPTTDRHLLLATLDELQPNDGMLRGVETLSAAAASLAQGYNTAKQIIILTDGQRHGWETERPARWGFLADVFDGLATPPNIVFRRYDLPGAFRNVAISEMTASRKLVGTDREVTINVDVLNTGDEAVTPAALELHVGDKILTDTALGQLGPGMTASARFSHRFATSGTHRVRARLVVDDDLEPDNTRDLLVTVTRSLPVLIVDGNVGGRFLERTGAFAYLALAPGRPPGAAATARADGDYMIDPQAVGVPDIGRIVRFDAYRAVILADVARLPADVAAALAAYVADGGGLLVAPGMRAEADFYNNWTVTAGQPVLPARIELRHMAERDDREIGPSLATLRHEVFSVLAGQGRSDIGAALLERYWVLEPDPSDGNVSVGGRLNTGHPFLLERRLGRGRVLMTCVSLDAQGGNLATRLAFLPLLHEMVHYLALPGTVNLNLGAGHGLVAHLARGDSAQRKGLRAEYFSGSRMTEPAATRVDPVIDFNWGTNAPAHGVKEGAFAVRWVGSVVPRYSDRYVIELAGSGPADLWLDGRHVIRKGGRAEIEMEAGRRYDVRVEKFHTEGECVVRLLWSGARQPEAPIGAAFLAPLRGEAAFADGLEAAAKDSRGVPRAAQLISRADGISVRVLGDVVPGVYTVDVPEILRADLHGWLGAEGELLLNVLSEAREGDLARLDDTDMEIMAGHADILNAMNVEHILYALEGKAFGEELWLPLAAAAFLLLLLELALTRWIAIQRRTGKTEEVEFEERTGPSRTFRQQLEKVRAGSVRGVSAE